MIIMNKKIIYCDMDGVLTDFVAGYTDIIGLSPSDVRAGRDGLKYSESWDMFLDARGFATLPIHRSGQQLIDYLNSIKDVQLCVLSSAGGFHRQREVQQQKVEWLTNHGIDWPVVIVPGRRYKAAFATGRSSLLIDDTLDVVREFAKIGRAIPHLEAKHTIPLIDLWLSDVR
jgi:hypothetical protein